MSEAGRVESSPAALEAEIRESAEAGDWARAITLALVGYGTELLGFLRALARSPTEAEDLFSELSERLWRKLPEFGWRSTFRTWAYTVARHLAFDRRRQLETRARREVALDDAAARAIADVVRSTIERSPASTDARLQLVRGLLDEDERTLVVLRIERRMSWTEIAHIVGEDGDEAKIARVTAKLRKQFERIKERLRRGLQGQRE